jgi:hypothetical protein
VGLQGMTVVLSAKSDTSPLTFDVLLQQGKRRLCLIWNTNHKQQNYS